MNKTENSAPNIVLIVTDQQRWDTLGCLGYDHHPDELYNLYDDPAHAGARGEMVERMMDWYGKTRMQR